MANNVWLLTWTTYGTWLPGDNRGFVGYIRQRQPADSRQRLDNAVRPDNASRPDDACRADDASRRVLHNTPGTAYDHAIPGLERYAREAMKGKPVWLTPDQADVFLAEAQRTARFRSWRLLAAAVMANHVHLVVIVPAELPGERLLQEFKSYGSRAMNHQFGTPGSGTWWTKSGSTRLLPDERAVTAAVDYVRRQDRPLVAWIEEGDTLTRTDPLTCVSGSTKCPGSTTPAEPTT